MRYLIDMDGVIADFEGGFRRIWKSEFPDLKDHLANNGEFYVEDMLPKKYKRTVREITAREGFFRSLPPIPGGLEALKELEDLGNEVFICTSPLLKNYGCPSEKFDWVKYHLGDSWARRMLVTKDKTLVHADALIDDRPELEGIQDPLWEHILYDQPYNQGINKRRLNWDNWKEILL